jgi:tetratricopeptide (TPR) repeat protein
MILSFGVRLWAGVFLALGVPSAVLAQGFDRVRLFTGGTESGAIESISDTIVHVKQSTGMREIAVNEIQTIQFDKEPIELTQARSEIRNGAYQEALQTLAKLRPAEIRRQEIRQDVEFYTALAKARLALSRGESQELRTAGVAMNEFVTAPANRRSFHYYEGVEVLGNILVAMGRFDQAETRYAALAETPWPDFKIRAGVLAGRALAAQGKHQEAIDRFAQALSLESTAPGVAEQRLAALLGKAQSQAEVGQADEAIQVVEQVIADAAPEDLSLQAQAHIALGNCHLKVGEEKEALFSFLYVDVLCSSVADAHAQALFHLIPLYQGQGREEDARQAQERLLERYPSSAWATKAAGGTGELNN